MGLIPTSHMRHILRLGAAVILAAALSGCAALSPQEASRSGMPDSAALPAAMPGDIVTASGQQVAASELAAAVADVRYVLLGEGHTNPCDHNVQADVLAQMAEAARATGRPVPAVGLEMVPVTHQQALDRFNAGELTADTLPDALGWDDVWGYAYSLYRPIFRVAEQYGLPLVALNIPKDVVRAVGAGELEALPATKRALVPERIIGPMDTQRESLREEFERHRDIMAHGGEDFDARIERFVRVQSLWDTVMAQHAVDASRRLHRPVAIIVGAGHVEYGWGIPHRLTVLDPDARVTTVLPWRGLEPIDADAADYFFLCPLRHESRLGFAVELHPEGALVTAIAPDTRADRAGMRQGDVIVKAQGMPVQALWTLHKAAVKANREDDGRLRLTLRRDGAERDIIIQLTRPGPGAQPPGTS